MEVYKCDQRCWMLLLWEEFVRVGGLGVPGLT